MIIRYLDPWGKLLNPKTLSSLNPMVECRHWSVKGSIEGGSSRQLGLGEV